MSPLIYIIDHKDGSRMQVVLSRRPNLIPGEYVAGISTRIGDHLLVQGGLSSPCRTEDADRGRKGRRCDHGVRLKDPCEKCRKGEA